MRKIMFILLMILAFCQKSYSQNEKCMAFCQDMIKDLKGKILSQFVCAADETVYVIKAEVLPDYDIDAIKAACDSVPKNVKVVSNWKLNYDKNFEKQFSISGKNILVTFYPNDKVLYFEFPKL